jgi:hypothetical protein
MLQTGECAFYLGHHWSYRREIGEPQPTFNFCKAFSDFLTNFALTNGVNFQSPHATEAIIPELLRTVWEEHQPQGKDAVMWELMQHGCTIPEAQALTPEGWKNLYELEGRPDLPIATLHPETGAFEWQSFSLNVFDFEGDLVHYEGQRINHVLTPEHDVWTQQSKTYTVRHGKRWDHGSKWRKRKAGETEGSSWSIRGGADQFDGRLVMPTVPASRQKPEYRFPSPEIMMEFIGWWVSEGSATDSGDIRIGQSLYKNPENFSEICDLLRAVGIGNSFEFARDKHGKTHALRFSHAGVARWLHQEFGKYDKERRLPSWVKNLPRPLLERLLQTLRKGDGDTGGERTWRYSSVSQRLADDVQEIAMKLGYLTQITNEDRTVQGWQTMWRVHIDPRGLMSLPKFKKKYYKGQVWCPTVPNGLWFMRLNGRAVVTGNSVSGDSFVKVAFEPEWQDPAGGDHPPRIRILPLNSAFVFPEYHPHDMTRLIRLKLKYRFWGCVDPDTQALTRRGWKCYWEIEDEDEILTLNPVTDEIEWQSPSAVSVYPYKGEMHRWTGKVDALTTPNHRWLAEVPHGRAHTRRTEREIVFSSVHPSQGQLVTGGGTPMAFADQPKWADELVETVGWYVTEGVDHYNRAGFHTIRISQKNTSPHIGRIRRLAAWWRDQDMTCNEWKPTAKGIIDFYFGKRSNDLLEEAAPGKQLTPEFLCSLTYAQARLLYETLLDGDGCRTRGQERWTQIDIFRVAGFQMLSGMLGMRGRYFQEKVTNYQSRYTSLRELVANHEEIIEYDGNVWCPTVPNSIWFARRNGTTYWTGNTALEGTRQVFSYTELWTEDAMQAFINDELVESIDNPLGVIPFVHIANTKVPSTPWGLSDIQDITDLNRIYNETAMLITDIINYYASPTTIIIGAKANNLERGAKKVWSIANKEASIQNLSLGEDGVTAAIAFLELIKEKMHELVGIPVTALGQGQPVSNTSGVAISLQFLPLIQKNHQKTIQYSAGLSMLNEIIIRTAALYLPEMLEMNPERDAPLEDGQLEVLDPDDPLTYRNTVVFASPLPIDKLIALNEIQMMMGMGLESKVGALRKLGEAYPREKLEELLNELHEDALEQGALDLLNNQISQLVSMLTGLPRPGAEDQMAAGQDAGGVTSAGGPDVNTAAGVQAPESSNVLDDPGIKDLYDRLTTITQGTKTIQVRNPLKSSND